MIYLLEDDDSIRKLVVYALQSQGYEALGFELPSAFWNAVAKRVPDLVLLDVMLPDEDGLTVLRKLRSAFATKAVPVIMVTAQNTEFDRVRGLDAGADDFISKPFGMMELVARVRAVLRRSEPSAAVREYRIGSLYLCPQRHQVQVDGKDIMLTYKEFSLLELLAENSGAVLTRDILMERIWGMETDRENRTLDVHIRTLRAKLGEAGSCIETVRGIGYKIGGTL